MEKINSQRLIQILQKKRQDFNQRIAVARHFNLRLDPHQFSTSFIRLTEPLIEKNPHLSLEELTLVTEFIFNRTLQLFSDEILGSSGKYPALDLLLDEAFARYNFLATHHTEELFITLANGYLSIFSIYPDQASLWAKKICILPEDLDDIDSFKAAGLVLAWINGLAAYRKSALKILETLPLVLIRALFDFTEAKMTETHSRHWLDALKINPWLSFSDAFNQVHSQNLVSRMAGAFRGFDGPFFTPPQVFLSPEGIIATDQESCWSLYADYYGTQLFRIPRPQLIKSLPENTSWARQNFDTILYLNQQFKLPEHYRLKQSTFASSGNTYCFTSAQSHHIFILGIGSA